MNLKKVFILLPDGIGLRNFVYTSFAKIGIENNWDITYWNDMPFDFSELGLKEEKLLGKASGLTNLYKRARKEIELENFEKEFNDSIYRKYRFKPTSKTLKQKVKNILVSYYIRRYRGKNLNKLRKKIKESERKTEYFKSCIKTLKKHKPAFVFSTNQRPVNAIAPILAAQDLGIPTATFIFSWDNLPKATMVIETDYYFVWSSHMKQELLTYYPYVKEDKIFITGTPQFEPHFENEFLLSKNEFLSQNKLPKDVDFVCFSGDDVTTSPHDPQYLEASALAIRDLNLRGHKLRILFRRCPVDFSNRFDSVLETYNDVIFDVAPKWKKIGSVWNTIMPLQADIVQLVNTIYYSSLVINVGSSMVFDYVCYDKPCAYINYNPSEIPNKKDIHTIYKYVHFRSMPSKEVVIWLSNSNTIADQLEQLLINKDQTVSKAKEWFEIINHHPPASASNRIWEQINNLV